MKELSPPKLIICDVDGTLIEPTERITPEFDVLNGLIAQNRLRFSLASGRCLDLLGMYMDKLAISEPVIINNGAGARHGGRVLWDTWLDPLSVKEAVKAADAMDMAIFLCTGDSETAYRHNAYIQREIDVFGRYNHFYIPLEREWAELRLEKVMITDPQKPGRIDRVLGYLEPYAQALNIVRYDDRHTDIMRRGVSKGGAVERLAEYLGIAMSDVMAIGDGANDVEMLGRVGIGVAVGNASESLKGRADYVCQERYTGGVIEAIQTFCV